MTHTPSTPLKTLLRAKEIAQSYDIKYVYIGNVPTDNNTYCDKCGSKLIDRNGYTANIENFKNNKCLKCGNIIKGVWS